MRHNKLFQIECAIEPFWRIGSQSEDSSHAKFDKWTEFDHNRKLIEFYARNCSIVRFRLIWNSLCHLYILIDTIVDDDAEQIAAGILWFRK